MAVSLKIVSQVVASGTPGPAGKSAYQIAVDNGFEGTESEWLKELHPFKGWFDSVSELEEEHSAPSVGEYAYVKGATSSEPVKIYECSTEGSWSDSGRTVDTSTVQTFGSGEAVNDVDITDDSSDIEENSDKIPTAGAVYEHIKEINLKCTDNTNSDFDISDEDGYVLARFKDGHFQTKNFDSSKIETETYDNTDADLDIADINGYVLARFKDGHFQTKNFDSRNGGGGGISDAPSNGLEYVRKNHSWVVNSASPTLTYPRPVIFDTDFGMDVDDVCAIRILLWAERMRLIDIVGICLDAVWSTSAPALSSFLNYEGRSNLCIGMDKQATDYPGTPLYHNTIINNWTTREYNSNNECQDCVGFYRRALTTTANKIDIIGVGFTNALSRLLNSPADEYSPLTGRELVAQKVNHLWLMAGNYPNGSEYNFNCTSRSRAAGADICANWPTEITFLGYEVGIQVICGNTLKSTIGSNDLLYQCLVAHGSGNGRYAWDPMTMLMACYGDMTVAGYNVTVGTNVVNQSTGVNTFTANPNGKHRYVTMKYHTDYYQYQLNKILEKIAWGYRTLGEQSMSKNY